MMEIKNLSVSYHAQGKPAYRALNHVSLTVPQGTVCAVLGPSGCGKSTLIKTVAGLLVPEQGEVLIDGKRVDSKAMTIGFMPQNYGLPPWRTALENVLLGTRIRRKNQTEARKRAQELFTELGIAGLEERFPRELSGGQQQRVALARAFLLAPDILLMDEPFSALDAITREEMQDVFLSLWRRESVTTLLVTHYVEEAIYLGGQIALMKSGGRLAKVLSNPLCGIENLRELPEFAHFAGQLRQEIKEMRETS